jgi:predicted N-acyltransferase
MQIVVAHSIEAFARDEWDRLFPGDLEGWAYYRAIEHSRLEGFDWVYFGVRERGELVAAVPAFATDYRLDTTLTGALRAASEALRRLFPRFLRQRLLSFGSPVGEVCHLGFAPQLDAVRRMELLELLYAEADRYAARRRIAMLAVKDASGSQDALWSRLASAHGLRRQPSLPTALLDVRFDSLDAYLASLGRATRKDLRRKLRAAAAVRIEWRKQIDDILDEVMRLYRETLAHAQFTFEELTPEFFRAILRDFGANALCATYWIDGRLVAFNLVLHDGTTLIDKFLGMDYAFVRRYNLYYLTWLENVRFCIGQRIATYQAGQGLHREKARLGCRLVPNWLWYRHRNRVLDTVFAGGERWFRLDRGDPALAALAAQPARDVPIAAWCVFLACAALSQIAFKYAARDTGPFEFVLPWFARAVGSGWLWVSVASHVGEFLLWMTILSRSSLSGAFATSAILFVVILAASAWLFGEPLGWSRLAGSAVILFGILLLGADEPQAGPPGEPPATDA